MREIEVITKAKEDLIDITPRVQEEIDSSGIENGLCLVYVPHTTAGVTINENADPSVREDLLMSVKKLVPDSLPFRHMEGNSPAHVKASLIGSSINLIIEESRLSLGTWQGIFFCEFDGPRNRKVYLKTFPSNK
jgi:secondary thiamine-phosphate synthase enzyme